MSKLTYPHNILNIIDKNYKNLELDINNFENILYNIYYTNQDIFYKEELDILFAYYKDNKTFEQLEKQFKLPVRVIQKTLSITFKKLKTEKIKSKLFINYKPIQILKEDISIDELSLSVRLNTLLKYNKIKTINQLLILDYSDLQKLPNINTALYKELLLEVKIWLKVNKYNIEWP